MIAIVWEFTVRADRLSTFKQHYGPQGTWSRLFRRGRGFRGTTLIEDMSDSNRFVTIDFWDALSDYSNFRREYTEAYATLNRNCEELTEKERELGVFSVVE